MKLVEPILPQGTKVKIGEGPAYFSDRLELQQIENPYVGQEKFIKSSWLADDGKIYYWVSEKGGASSVLVQSSNLERSV